VGVDNDDKMEMKLHCIYTSIHTLANFGKKRDDATPQNNQGTNHGRNGYLAARERVISLWS